MLSGGIGPRGGVVGSYVGCDGRRNQRLSGYLGWCEVVSKLIWEGDMGDLLLWKLIS